MVASETMVRLPPRGSTRRTVGTGSSGRPTSVITRAPLASTAMPIGPCNAGPLPWVASETMVRSPLRGHPEHCPAAQKQRIRYYEGTVSLHGYLYRGLERRTHAMGSVRDDGAVAATGSTRSTAWRPTSITTREPSASTSMP